MSYDLPSIGDNNGRRLEGKAALVNAFRVDPLLSNESYSSSAKVIRMRSAFVSRPRPKATLVQCLG
jgi:hypothetical protein